MSGRIDPAHWLRSIFNKYQTPFGIAIWGFTAPGAAVEVLCDALGQLQVVTVAGSLTDVNLIEYVGAAVGPANPMDVQTIVAGAAIDPRDRSWTLGALDVPDLSDRVGRLLGIIYGDQGQLTQRAATLDLYAQLRSAGAEIDPRDRNWSLGAADVPDLSDRWARQLGQTDLARVLGAALTNANPVLAGIFDAAGNRMPSMDAAARPGFVDMIDRAGRLVGAISGTVDITELPAAAALSDTFANPTTTQIGSFLMGWENGASQWERVAIDASGRLEIVSV